MLTLIHGDDISASRKYLIEIKQKYPDSVTLEGEKIDLTDLAQILEGGGLFDENKSIFIEQLFTKKKKSSDLDRIVGYLQKNSDENNIFLWEGKELEKSALNKFRDPVVRFFKIPQTLFAFLDSLKPGNGKTLIFSFHKAMETSEADMIFFMIVRQFRLLLALYPSQPPLNRGGVPNSPPDKGESEGVIDELKRLSPWQKSKLEKQSVLFGNKKLRGIYSRLFDIELGQKTGTLSFPMRIAIDFLLLEI